MLALAQLHFFSVKPDSHHQIPMQTTMSIITMPTRTTQNTQRKVRIPILVSYDCELYHSFAEFISRFWMRNAIVAVLGYSYYKYAPSPSSDSYLTRWLAATTPSKDHWLAKDAEHTAGSLALSQEHMLFSDAKPRPVHRYRHPQCVQVHVVRTRM